MCMAQQIWHWIGVSMKGSTLCRTKTRKTYPESLDENVLMATLVDVPILQTDAVHSVVAGLLTPCILEVSM